MREEYPESFPQQNDFELVHVYVESELKKVGIELQQINIDGTVTTDKEVPEEIVSSIRQYAANKGITIEFLTSG